MKTGICGKGGQKVPVGTGQGHVRVGAMTVGGTERVIELSATARRAVEAALAAGAGDAEAYASRDSGREVRVHGGEVESLTAATQSGIGVRAWIGGRVGYAYGTDLSEAGRRGDRRARRRGGARSPTRTSSPAPPRAGRDRGAAGLERPLGRRLDDGRGRRAGADGRAHRARRRPARRRGRAGRLRRLRRAGRDRLLDRGRRRVRVLRAAYAYLQALAEGEGGRETGLGFGLARGPGGLDPEAIGARGRPSGRRR